MGWFIASVVAVIAVTTFAAWLIETRMTSGSRLSHTLLAAASFPALAFVIFVVMTIITLVQPAPHGETGTQGAVVFAFGFFLVYACFGGLIVGLPTAFVAIKAFRAG